MGCALSKKEEEGEDVVSLCRERKRLMKLAVKRRYAFADAQCKYNQSLYSVAMALRLFVARHSSPSSPVLITFPSSKFESNEAILTNPMFLQQTPTLPVHETIACEGKVANFSVGTNKDQGMQDTQEGVCHGTKESEVEVKEESESESESGSGGESEEVVCEHFYDDGCVGCDSVNVKNFGQSQSMPSPQREFVWDFFNPFDAVNNGSGVVNGYSQSCVGRLREEGRVQGLEEKTNKKEERSSESAVINERSGSEVDAGEANSLRVIDTPTNGRELLEALKDVEDHFLRAHESGLEISRMLEANRIQLQSGFEEIRENSNKLIRSITWSRSTSSRSSSCKSLLTSSSTSSSMFTESKNDLFDESGMRAGSHSLTLGRLYAWEKKLYQEVKAGDEIRKMYERKSSRLKNNASIEDDQNSSDNKHRAEVKDLYSRISVTLRSAETISATIERLSDEELQPQLLELLHGLMRNWKIMLGLHEMQYQVMLEVKYFTIPAHGKFCNDSHRLATLQLRAELDNWCSCFATYLCSHKAYIEALSTWLCKFVPPEIELYSKCKSSLPPFTINGLPLLVTCHDWLVGLEKLPDKIVVSAMKSFVKDIHALWNQQGREQQQKRKVDGLTKEIDRRTLTLQRAESKFLKSKLSMQESDATTHESIKHLGERRNALDILKHSLDEEKGKHIGNMQETQRITINGFQTGFSLVFQSLTGFSKASSEMYADLVTYGANAKTEDKLNNFEDISSQMTS